MQPSEYAMRGHHESSLIQFKHGTPQIIYNELLEITELPFNPTKNKYVFTMKTIYKHTATRKNKQPKHHA